MELPKYESVDIDGKTYQMVTYEDFENWMTAMGMDISDDDQVLEAADMLDRLINPE